MKGQQQIVSAILISGILVGVVGSVYLWGIPLIQKNRDISTLENSEYFIKNLNEKIKTIVNSGGTDQIPITIPGIVSFDGSVIELVVDTQGTTYATNAEIPLGRNPCALIEGEWGKNDPEVICVKSIGETTFRTTYTLRYILLTSGARAFKIDLIGESSSGGEDHYILIKNKGVKEETLDGKNLISTVIEISIV